MINERIVLLLLTILDADTKKSSNYLESLLSSFSFN